MKIISVLTRKSLADVTRRKGRTILMVVGILIGVLGLTAVDVANDAFGKEFVNLLAPTDLPNMIFNVNTVSTTVAADLQKMPNVQIFQVRTQLFSQWHFTGKRGSASLEINSYQDWSHVQLGSFQLTSGRLPGPGEIVMATRDRFVQSVAPGDTVSVESLDGRVVSLRVVGLAYTDEQSSSAAIGYMSTDAVQQLARGATSEQSASAAQDQQTEPPFSQEIMIKTLVGDRNSVQQTYRQVSALLVTDHLSVLYTQWFATTGQADVQFTISSAVGIFLALTAIALLLVCFMIFNTMSIVLAEQMRIIGTMKAIGGTRLTIIRSYLLSVSIYAVLGTALGLFLGLGLCEFIVTLVANQARLDLAPFQISPGVVLTSVAVGLLVPLLAALPPLWVGTGVTVRQAMASYGVSAGVGKYSASWGQRLPWVPQVVWLGIRSTFRKPGRAIVTLLALSIAAAVFMAAQLANESIGATADHSLHLYNYDASAVLAPDQARSQRLLAAIQALPNVAQIEPAVGRTFVTTTRGEMEIESLPPSTPFYHPQLLAGRWLTPGDTGTIVLSDLVAQRLGLQVGDTVAFRVGTARGELENWRVVGIVHEDARATSTVVPHVELGLAFTTPQNVQTLHLPPDVPEIWLLVHDRSTSALQSLSIQLTSIFSQAGLQPDFSIRSLAIQQDAQAQVLIYVLFDTFAILIGLVGLLSLSNTLAAGVFERRLEIGILRSLGATNWRVGVVFCVEGLALVALAWGAGTVLGAPGGLALMNVLNYYFQPYEIVFSALALPLTLLFMIVVVLLASFGPAFSASRVRIAETLRYE